MPPSSTVTLAARAALALQLLLLLLAAVLLASASPADRGPRESFSSWPALDTLDNFRGDALAAAGMSLFYTCTTTSVAATSGAMFVTPTASDVLRAVGPPPTSQPPPADTLSSVACMDSRFPRPPPGAAYGACESVASYTPPAESQTCIVRVFDGSYSLTKSCVTLFSNRRLVQNPRPGSHTALFLTPSAPSTALLVLLRPSFLVLPGGNTFALLHQPYADSASNAGNSLCDYDSSRPEPLHVRMEVVLDPLIVASPPEAAPLVIQQSVTFDAYFLRYNSNLGLVPSDPNVGRVLTLYIAIPAALPAPADGSVALFAMAGVVSTMAVSLTVDDSGAASVVVSCSAAPQTCSLAVGGGGLVVVTFTDNLLVLTSIETHRVASRSFAVQAVYDAADYGGAAQVADYVAAAGVRPSAGLSPYDNTCIPDLADIAVRLRSLPVMVFT